MDAFIVLEVRDLRVDRGGGFVLDIPSLSISSGELVSLIGPNGSGKTTLLMALASLLPAQTGQLLFRGQPVNSVLAPLQYRRKLAMVFQESLLLDTTVFENVATGLRFRGMRGREVEKRVIGSLERFRIPHLRNRSARTLSGGEAQRTSLARAFAVRPEILLLDEPFAALDPPTRDSLMEDIHSILKETGTTTILTTHDRLEALRLSDRMAVMFGGRILQMGPPREVLSHPADALVADFVNIDNVLKVLTSHIPSKST